MAYWTRLINFFCGRDRGWILSLFVAVLIIYLPFLGNPFFFDDLTFFTAGVAEAYKNNWDLSLRWLPYSSLGWISTVFSNELPHIYHLFNLLLHAVNSVLIFYFLRNFLGAVLAKDVESATTVRNAWFGALIFALHPVAVFAVGYAIQISILMATMFSLLMLLAYLRGLLSGQGRWFALAVLAYFLACFSKEHSVLMPAVLVAMGLLVYTENRVSRRVMWLAWLGFFAVALLVTLRAKGVLGSPYEPMAAQLFAQQGIEAGTPMLHLLSALTQAGLFFKYLLLWMLPDPSLMSIDMRESFIASASAWQAWFGGIVFMLYGALGIRLLLRGGMSGLSGFAMLYPWLLFWVEMSGIRMQEPFVLYRSYLWMPGMMLFFPLLLTKLTERKAMLVMACLVIVLVPLSFGRLRVFSDSYRLWNEAASLLKNDRVAGADRIFYNRGQAEMAAKRWEDAASDLKRSANISPQFEPTHYLMGLAYTNSAHPDEALLQFDVAIAIKPDDDRVYFAKGMTLKAMHRDIEAMQQMELSCKLRNRAACLIASFPGRHQN
jgi:tetratricopeptide (TPR) repeat protein